MCKCWVSVAEEKDSKRGMGGDAREGPAPGSRTREDPLGPHCPGCPPRNQFLPSMEDVKTRQDVLFMKQDTVWEKEEEPTSNAMWSFPTRISSSCFPTMLFFGQFVSSSLSAHAVLWVRIPMRTKQKTQLTS